MEEKTLTIQARERRDPCRGQVPPSWRRGKSPYWPGNRPPEVKGGRSFLRKRSETAPRASTPPNTLSTSGLLRQREKGVSLWNRHPASSPLLTEAGDTPGKEEESAFSLSGVGKNSPSTSLHLDSGTGQSPSAQISSRPKEPSTPERSTLGGRGTPPRGRRQLLVGRGSSPPPQRDWQGVGGVPPSSGRTSFSSSPSFSSLRSSSSGDPDPLPSLEGSAKYWKSH